MWERPFQGTDFQDRADFEDLSGFRRFQLRDPEPLMGLPKHQPFGGEAAQGFADWDAADLELGRQLVLAHGCARLQLAPQYLISDRIGDLVRGCL